MYRSSTTDFILSPLSDVLSTATESLVVAGEGMYGYQIADWVMPTIFLKMTGAQEQKLKCIYWDLGSIDLDTRNQRYSKGIGEMSCYDDKNKLCGELISYLVRNKRGFDPMTSIEREALKQSAIDEVSSICCSCMLKEWYADYYKDFEEVVNHFNANQIVEWNVQKDKYKELLKEEMREAYEALYFHRIRCAHNSTSFQSNLPKFEVLSGSKAIYENYFVRFFLLLLLDKLFVQLYRWAIELTDF